MKRVHIEFQRVRSHNGSELKHARASAHRSVGN